MLLHSDRQQQLTQIYLSALFLSQKILIPSYSQSSQSASTLRNYQKSASTLFLSSINLIFKMHQDLKLYVFCPKQLGYLLNLLNINTKPGRSEHSSVGYKLNHRVRGRKFESFPD